MIRFLQNPTKGRRIILGIVLGVVIVSMVAFLGSYFTNSDASSQTAGIYATVNGEPITVTEVQAAAQRSALQQGQGRALPEFYMAYIRRQTAENLVTKAALIHQAERMGLAVTEQEMIDQLHEGGIGKELFPNGNFIGKERYAEFISANFQLDVPRFEKLIKDDILMSKLQSIVEAGATVPQEQLKQTFIRQNTKVKFDYAFITTVELLKKVSVTDAELRAYFEKNKATFTNSIPEQRKAKYVVINAARVPVELTDEDFQRAYAQRKDQFKTPEKVDVRHILVKTKEQALAIKKQLEGGAKFDALAKKYSDDPGSKDKGGLYEGVTRGQMVAAFDQVAFSQPVGKISDPVQTNFGFHIIRVDAHRPEHVRSLQEVKKEIEPALRAEKSGAQVDALATQIESEARKDGLEKAAARHGLTVTSTEFFNQTAVLPGVGPSPQFMQELFALAVKGPAEKVSLADGYAVAQVVDSKPASTPTFEQARARVEQQFRGDRAGQMLAQKTQELADRAHALHDLKKAAKELGAAVKSSGFVAPNGQVPDVGAMTGPAGVAFDLKPGEISKPLASGQNGVVLAVVARQEPNAADFDKVKDQLREQLVQQKRNEVMQLFAIHVRERMLKDGSIRINEREQQRLFGNAAGI